MALLINQIKELLKKPPQNPQKRLAVDHESRVRFHSETTLGRIDTSNAINDFLRYVQGILPNDKYAMFLHLFRYPIDTIPTTEEIYKALEKVYDGQNPVFEYEFPKEEILADWEEYRKESKQDDFWRYEFWEAIKTQINAIMIVDLSKEQDSERPKPYTFLLDLNATLFYETKGEIFEHIAFWSNREENELAVFDDETYRVFKVNDSNEIQSIIVENSHNLGYCPARFMWTTPKSNRQKQIKKSPVSNYLGKLDWLLFYSISKKAIDTYGSYPIVSVFRVDCDFEDEITGEDCHNGFLKNQDGNFVLLADRTTGTNYVKPCPVCSKSNLTGAGSKIIIDPPSPENESADLRNPVQFHQMDRNILDYNVDELKRLQEELIAATTGGSIESPNNKAVNEKQIMALFEGRKALLNHIKENLERARKWSDETQCLLRYGQEIFKGAFISYGTEYFLFSEPQLLELYAEAKKAGHSPIVLDYIQDQYFQTKYRNNREGLKRSKILLNLEPYRHLTANEVQAFNTTADEKEFILKVNFSSLIQRFETENTTVTQFGSNVSFDVKLQRIREALYNYIIIPKETKIKKDGSE